MLTTTFILYTLALLIGFNIKFYMDDKRSKKTIEIRGKKTALRIKAKRMINAGVK